MCKVELEKKKKKDNYQGLTSGFLLNYTGSSSEKNSVFWMYLHRVLGPEGSQSHWLQFLIVAILWKRKNNMDEQLKQY